jgi:hypothetical protein
MLRLEYSKSGAGERGRRNGTMAFTYWQHNKSGDIYAVQTDMAGMAIGVTGPISQDEATVENYGNFDYDAEDVEWANAEEMHYYDPTTVR